MACIIRYFLRRENRKMDMLDETEQPYTGGLTGLPRGYRFIY